ncbi:Phage-associated protein, HI1409 family [Mycoavidus cysteinexigens]|uniref:Phage-associated protein, HI1409 family n=3 Tax=Mycoavidus cysteinexigens TaxID=1553431 RepID=A0A2Z6ET75_9BURK|nr:anti-CBASS Acb1 family protein [Mycoavidus cysteinexigens]BBE08590.1 Phage-associated protein, HI1409 family [Mycoavidus cysteinexigens]
MSKKHKNKGVQAIPTLAVQPTDITQDSLTNLVAGLMNSRDKMAYNHYAFRKTISRSELATMYRSNWLARKIIDAPAEDMTREWLSLETKDENSKDKLEAAEKRFKLVTLLTNNLKWGRLFGGSALYMSLAGEDPETPLEIKRIRRGALQGFLVLDQHQLTVDKQPCLVDLNRPEYWRPEYYRVAETQQIIHASRLIFSDGALVPVSDLKQQGFWHDSVLQALYDELQRGDTVASGTASMFFEMCVDILKIDGLTNKLNSDEGTREVQKRFEVTNTAKSFNRMMLLDSADDYQQKTINFGGVSEVATMFLQRISGAADIPATRLLGQSPTGLSATGESDIRNYYDALKAKQENILRPQVEKIYDVMAMSELGHPLKDLVIEFNPLWQLCEAERANAEKIRAETDQIYLMQGVIHEAHSLKRLKANDTYAITDEDLDEAQALAQELDTPDEPDATRPDQGTPQTHDKTPV